MCGVDTNLTLHVPRLPSALMHHEGRTASKQSCFARLGRIAGFFRLLQPVKLESTPHTVLRCIHCSCCARHSRGFPLAMLALTRPIEAPGLLRMYNTAECWDVSSLSCAPTCDICPTPLRTGCTACCMYAPRSTSHHCVYRPGKDTQEYYSIQAQVGIRPTWLHQNLGCAQAWTVGESYRGWSRLPTLIVSSCTTTSWKLGEYFALA